MHKFDFLQKGLELVFSLILWIIFQEKYISCYVLLTDQISMHSYHYFLRYWTLYVI